MIHFIGAGVLALGLFYAFEAGTDLITAFETRDSDAVISASIDLVTPTVIQAGMSVAELGNEKASAKPCAPHLPCKPELIAEPVTPPVLTFFDED